MGEIKLNKNEVPVWNVRLLWWAEEHWWNMICCFEDIWGGVVDLAQNPVWWSLVLLTGVVGFLTRLLFGWL
jgi:hypothetical protein